MTAFKRLRFDYSYFYLNRDSRTVNFTLVLFLLGIIACSGCAQITVKPGTNESFSSSSREADFEKSMPYYLFGIIGVRHVDVRTICKERRVVQLRSVHTPMDVVKTIFTLGLYMPKTAQVWCATEHNNY